MIRPYRPDDLKQIMPLWLKTTIAAHPFIHDHYWHEAKPLVENEYLPAAQTWVYEEQQKIVGFISILENQLIGALFVAPDRQKTGVGKALLHYAQMRYPLLLLEVYPQNERAYRFYQKMGFVTVSEAFNQETGAMLATMCFKAN